MSILRHFPRITAAAFFLLAAFGSASSNAQNWPNRPITLIYPYVSGSAQEGAYRVMLAEAGRILGQPYLIENKPGANSRLGINAIKEGKPDGYVTTLGSDANLVHQPKEDPVAYRIEMYKDYTPIIFLTKTEFVIVAHPSVPFRDLKGLISYAKANPGKLNWAGASGSTSTLMSLKVQKAAGIDVTMITYKGAGETISALVGGQIDLFVNAQGTLKQNIDAGKIIALASSGAKRSAILPNVPTLTEAGLPMPPMATWFGIISPAGTPPDVVSKIYKAVHAGVVFPEAARLFAVGAYFTEPSWSTNDYAEYIKSETAAWK